MPVEVTGTVGATGKPRRDGALSGMADCRPYIHRGVTRSVSDLLPRPLPESLR